MTELPTFVELAECRLSELSRRDKVITIKISRGTAEMMVEAEKAQQAQIAQLQLRVRELELSSAQNLADFQVQATGSLLI